MANPQIKTILLKHGITEPLLGVKIGDMKPIQKKIKKDYKLSMELYNSGVYDAMYLAGLIADEDKMSKKEITDWAKRSNNSGVSEYTVSWVAAESKYGWELELNGLISNELIASSGWSTLAGWLSLKPDSDLDIKTIRSLLSRIAKQIHKAPNRVRYVMNNFIICAGSYVTELTAECMALSDKIGTVMVDMGGTACKIPDAAEYINKVKARGSLGKKKKTVAIR